MVVLVLALAGLWLVGWDRLELSAIHVINALKGIF